MLRELESACEPHFNTLSRTPWVTVKQVSGPSAYVQDLTNVIEQITETIKPVVEQKKYSRNFFDKISTYVILGARILERTDGSLLSSTVFAKFTNALVRSRPLLEIGAEQVKREVLSAIRQLWLTLHSSS